MYIWDQHRINTRSTQDQHKINSRSIIKTCAHTYEDRTHILEYVDSSIVSTVNANNDRKLKLNVDLVISTMTATDDNPFRIFVE